MSVTCQKMWAKSDEKEASPTPELLYEWNQSFAPVREPVRRRLCWCRSLAALSFPVLEILSVTEELLVEQSRPVCKEAISVHFCSFSSM